MIPFWISELLLAANQHSITDRSIDWPTWEQWRRTLLLEDYNTRVVVLATTMLGMAAGIVGAFTLLRRRALMGDALAHATLPGIGLAFILGHLLGVNGKSLPILLIGAAASGILGMIAILAIRSLTRIKEDTALGIVLSVFFGGGIAILRVVTDTAGNASGLESFIYGKTASIVASDAWLIGFTGLVAIVVLLLLFKELQLLCFDQGYASASGFSNLGLDSALMGTVVLVTIVGLQAVGLVLMIALLVIPAAAARFWTLQMRAMVWIAGVLGAMSCMVGAGLSGIFPNLPSGAMIVLTASTFFVVSLLLGSARGIFIRAIRRSRLNRRIDRQHVLRGVYELLERQGFLVTKDPLVVAPPVSVADLLSMRSWTLHRLEHELSSCEREGWLILRRAKNSVVLTALGLREAQRLTHEHRLWELYLIHFADVAPGQVDRDADTIEHVLDTSMIDQLEELLNRSHIQAGVVASPHDFEDAISPALASNLKSGA